MVAVRRSSLNLLSIGVGVLFTCAIFYTMHYNPRWDWTAPGVGKLPREIVEAFLDESYGKGRGADAVHDYFSPKTIDNVADAQERRNGVPMPDTILRIVAQGQEVVVFHRIGAARGEPAADVIDDFVTADGRIMRRERYPTRFTR